MATKKAKETPENELTAEDLIGIERSLSAVSNLKPKNGNDARFIYAVNKNFDTVQAIVKRVRKMMKDAPEEYKEYQQKAYSLAVECGAQEQAVGNGQTVAGEVKDTEKYAREIAKLNKKYEKVISENAKVVRANEKITREPITEPVEWYMTKYKFIPADVTAGQRSRLMFMLEEPTEEDFDSMDFLVANEDG